MIVLEALFTQFEEILQQETELYCKILEISKKKVDIIIAGDIAGLDNVTKVEQGLILHAGALERRREQFIQEKMMKYDGMSSCKTLSELIQFAPASHKQQLASIGNELGALLEEQKDINTLNSSLIRNNLEYIDNILSKIQGNTDVYNMGGTKVKGDFDTSVLDKKI